MDYTLFVHSDDAKATASLAREIREGLAGKDVKAKIEALKKAIVLVINGETIPELFTSVILNVLPCSDYTVQKLVLLYLENMDRTDLEGKMLPELNLISQHLRNNLQHPNEYIRGATLRFICRLEETEMVVPLVSSILSNLDHVDPYVKRNALLAVKSVHKLSKVKEILLEADVPEILEKILATEQDESCKRNAFLALLKCSPDRAKHYLFTNTDRINDWGEPLQMAVLELIKERKLVLELENGNQFTIMTTLLDSPSAAVVYECAGTLVSLSSDPSVISFAANAYRRLLLSKTDDTVKLLVLDRLGEIKISHREIIVGMARYVLEAHSSPNLDIRRKTLEIAFDVLSSPDPEEVVVVGRLKEE